MKNKLVVYACGSPVRQDTMKNLSIGSKADLFVPNENPIYQGGNSIVWGLIRGADRLMDETTKDKYDFYQVDNAYFGRKFYYRITKNKLQIDDFNVIDYKRYKKIFGQFNLSLKPWKTIRNGPIVICLSSGFLYNFYKINIQDYLNKIIFEIKLRTDRPILIRSKDANKGIDVDINDAWCVITHVSASALDALRLGVPVITTGQCAASLMSTSIDRIESPEIIDRREDLFASLAWAQFNEEEMLSGLAWDVLHKN